MDTVPDTTEVEEIVASKKQTRFRKRQWEDNDTTNGVTQEKREKPFERVKKKKMAMLLGYCGVDYYGMQR